jgi:hypothetical protein
MELNEVNKTSNPSNQSICEWSEQTQFETSTNGQQTHEKMPTDLALREMKIKTTLKVGHGMT